MVDGWWYVSGIDLCSFAADTRAWTLSGAVINSTVHHIKNVALGVQTNRKKEMHHTHREPPKHGAPIATRNN